MTLIKRTNFVHISIITGCDFATLCRYPYMDMIVLQNLMLFNDHELQVKIPKVLSTNSNNHFFSLNAVTRQRWQPHVGIIAATKQQKGNGLQLHSLS